MALRRCQRVFAQQNDTVGPHIGQRFSPRADHDARGNPIAVPETHIFVWAREKVTGTGVGFPITGAGPELTEYTPELHLTSGRMFRRGLRELIASNYCARMYKDFSVGDTRVIEGNDWRVVGNFNLGRTEGTCTVYADVGTVLSTFDDNGYNEVNVMLQSPSAFDELVDASLCSHFRFSFPHQW